MCVCLCSSRQHQVRVPSWCRWWWWASQMVSLFLLLLSLPLFSYSSLVHQSLPGLLSDRVWVVLFFPSAMSKSMPNQRAARVASAWELHIGLCLFPLLSSPFSSFLCLLLRLCSFPSVKWLTQIWKWHPSAAAVAFNRLDQFDSVSVCLFVC